MIYPIFRAIVRLFFPLFCKLTAEGRENIPQKGGYIICGNHVTMMDFMFVGITVRHRLIFWAKAELFRNPFMWILLRLVDAISVDRGKGDMSIIDKSVEKLKRGDVFNIFPEGTRTKNGSMGRFKSGSVLIAYQTKADILPVGITVTKVKWRFRRRVYLKYGPLLKSSELFPGGTDAEKVTPGLLKAANAVLFDSVARLLPPREEQ